MITAQTVAYVVSACFGVWAAGYGVGQAVAWTRKIRDIA